jgi:3-deoxy-D-manno-octulosonate 8-phosphate phosphatase (KDO 8-P phosphatase)
MKLLISDIDGVLTNGKKHYDLNGEITSKEFNDKDFTAIKRFKENGINFCLVSGDHKVNEKMALKRKIDFYCTREAGFGLDKSRYLDLFIEKYQCPIKDMAFVGDDYYDLSIIKSINPHSDRGLTFCPSDSPMIVKRECGYVLKSKGGDSVIAELFDFFFKF